MCEPLPFYVWNEKHLKTLNTDVWDGLEGQNDHIEIKEDKNTKYELILY